MTWHSLNIDDQHGYTTSIYPTRARALADREKAGFIGLEDLVIDDYGGKALITDHEVPFSEVLLLSLLIAVLGAAALVAAVATALAV